MFLLVIILVCSSLQYLSYETFHFSTRPLLRRGGFGKKGVRIFSSKKPTKFGSFGHFFPKGSQKTNPLDLIFQRVPAKNWGFGFQPSFWGVRIKSGMSLYDIKMG